MTNALYYGDNLQVLREHIADESVDLVYLDPPFNSNATYNVLFRSPKGRQAEAQIEAFEDTWHWGEHAEQAFDEVMQSGRTDAAEMLRAMRGVLRENDMMAYLAMMAVRLIELHRVLKPTGSLYLHCDPTASHYLKVLLDGIFGPQLFGAEIIWKRTNARGTPANWPHVHDVIFYYKGQERPVFRSLKVKAEKAKTPHTLITGADGHKYQTYELTAPGQTKEGVSGQPWRGFDPNKWGRHWANIHHLMDDWDAAGLIHWPAKSGFPRRRAQKSFDPDSRVVTVGDVWTDIDRLNQSAKERLGYPTQKPLALMERIIQASSKPGDLVLDPFCGCGTTVHAAQKLERRWIGIDITHLAISLIERRLKAAFPGIAFEVLGRPASLEDAEELARRDKDEFERWAVWMVDGSRAKGKKGADRGIDGLIYFKPDGKTTEIVVVSVKGGENVGVGMIRDLHSVMMRDGAPIGVFITKALPTRPMEAEAASAGFFECDAGKFPRLQIITLAELFQGKRPRIPLVDPTIAFRNAPRERVDRQGKLGV